MRNRRIKVLYIAGFERSGSTLINRVLGQIDDFVAWGELRDIWEHGEIENRTCTCGASFEACEAWSRILDEHFYQNLGLSAQAMLALKKRARAAVLLAPLGKVGSSLLHKATSDYSAGLEQLYWKIAKETDSKVIIDSTKASWYGYVLSQICSIDLYSVHIVRDPRGVCFSLQKRKEKGEPECQWYNPVHASLSWVAKNAGVESLLGAGDRRYMRMRYEDFVDSPEAAVASILSFIGEDDADLPFLAPSTVKMGLDHIITGSPSSRADVGEVKLRADERWKQSISLRDRRIVTYATLPLLLKYGYSHKV